MEEAIKLANNYNISLKKALDATMQFGRELQNTLKTVLDFQKGLDGTTKSAAGFQQSLEGVLAPASELRKELEKINTQMSILQKQKPGSMKQGINPPAASQMSTGERIWKGTKGALQVASGITKVGIGAALPPPLGVLTAVSGAADMAQGTGEIINAVKGRPDKAPNFLYNAIKSVGKTLVKNKDSIWRGLVGALKVGAGAIQVGTGVALSSTGLGAVLGVPVAAFGAASMAEGIGDIVNAVKGKNEDGINPMKEAFKWTGRQLGGKKGENIASGMFTAADVGLSLVGPGSVKAFKEIKEVGSVAKYVRSLGKPKFIEEAGKFVKNIPEMTKELLPNLKSMPSRFVGWGAEKFEVLKNLNIKSIAKNIPKNVLKNMPGAVIDTLDKLKPIFKAGKLSEGLTQMFTGKDKGTNLLKEGFKWTGKTIGRVFGGEEGSEKGESFGEKAYNFIDAALKLRTIFKGPKKFRDIKEILGSPSTLSKVVTGGAIGASIVGSALYNMLVPETPQNIQQKHAANLPGGAYNQYPELVHGGKNLLAKQQTGGSSQTSITIPKLADSIVIREDADIDKVANALAVKLRQYSVNMGVA